MQSSASGRSASAKTLGDGLCIWRGFAAFVFNLEVSKAKVTVMTENDALTAEEVTRIRDVLLNQVLEAAK